MIFTLLRIHRLNSYENWLRFTNNFCYQFFHKGKFKTTHSLCLVYDKYVCVLCFKIWNGRLWLVCLISILPSKKGKSKITINSQRLKMVSCGMWIVYDIQKVLSWMISCDVKLILIIYHFRSCKICHVSSIIKNYFSSCFKK